MRGRVYRKRRADGSWSRWYAVIDVPPGPDGRRRQKTTTHDTRAGAQEWLARTAAATSVENAARAAGDVPVAEYLAGWLAGKAGLRPSSRRTYAQHVERYLVPALGQRWLSQLRPEHIEAMYAPLLAAGRPGPATLRRVHATLAAALASAVRRHLIAGNPAEEVELPPAPRVETPVWTPAQARRFLAATRDDAWFALYWVLLLLGLRRGEALGLRWCDLDLDAGVLRVVQQRVQVGSQVLVGPPKSAAGRRTLPLDPETVGVLRAHRAAQHADRLRAGPAWGETGLVFTTPLGAPLRPAAVSRRFPRLCQQAGVPVIRLHDLRHTSASLGLAAGASLKEVSVRLGHSDIAVTANLYAHVVPPLSRASADRLAALLTSPSVPAGGAASA